MGSVLLTDAQQRKTLVAARSLGGRGITVVTAEETRVALANFSKYSARCMVYPSPRKQPHAFYLWLKDYLLSGECDVFFPMDDCSIQVVMNHWEELVNLCCIPVPEVSSYEIAADKALATAAAREVGIDCPETISPRSLDELMGLSLNMKFPVVLKPRKSSGSRGITVVVNRAEFVPKYLEVHRTYPFPIVQEYIPQGEKYDVCLLFGRDTELKASFVQKEIRCFPLEKGPSTVQESVWFPELVEKCTTLMKKIKWFGVAEVEFMVDPRTGRHVFMEINPRFWASLNTAVLAGVDFPWLLYQLALGEDITQVTTYTVGVKCRWSLPGDLLHFLVNKNRFHLSPPFFQLGKSGGYDDIISLEDPMPTFGFFLACLRYLPDRAMWRLMFRR